MGTLLGLVCIITECVVLAYNYDNAVLLYFILANICPNIQILSHSVSFEIIAFFPVMIIFLTHKKYRYSVHNNLCKTALIFMFIWVGYFIINSLIALSGKLPVKLAPIRLIALIRFICLVWILEEVVYRKGFVPCIDRIYSTILYINIVVMFVQYTIKDSIYIFADLYGKTNSSAYQREVMIGFFTRAYGTYASPTVVGGVMTFVFAFYAICYITSKGRNTVKKLLITMLAGILSGTKMFVFGMIIIVVMSIAFLVLFRGRKGMQIAGRIVGICIVFGVIGLMLMYSFGQLERIVRYISDPIAQLSSRYGSEGSMLNENQKVLFDKLWLGFGATLQGAELMGDSLYYVILHDLGLVGTLFYICFLLFRMIAGMHKKNIWICIYVIMILTMGLGDPLYFAFYSVIPTMYILFGDYRIDERIAGYDA